MPIPPRIEEIFEEKVIDNSIALIARDMKLMLDHYYLASNYPDFAERTLGNFIRLSFPALAVEPDRGESDEPDHFAAGRLRLIYNFAVTDADAPTTERKGIRYLRALRSVLRNGTRADYMTGVTTALPFTQKFEWDYGELGKNPNNANEWMKPISLVQIFDFNER